MTDEQAEGPDVLEKLILRMYWEKEDIPSVECPLGAFFCCGYSQITVDDMKPEYHSPFVTVPARSFHCYFPMPFHTHAKITLENQYGAEVSVVAYQVTYTAEKPDHSDQSEHENMIHFHAKYRRSEQNGETGAELLAKIIPVRKNEICTYAGVYLSAAQDRPDESDGNTEGMLVIRSKDGFVWYEPVFASELYHGGYLNFRMKHPILFDGELELSLQSVQAAQCSRKEYNSTVYWYEA